MAANLLQLHKTTLLFTSHATTPLGPPLPCLVLTAPLALIFSHSFGAIERHTTGHTTQEVAAVQVMGAHCTPGPDYSPIMFL